MKDAPELVTGSNLARKGKSGSVVLELDKGALASSMRGGDATHNNGK